MARRQRKHISRKTVFYQVGRRGGGEKVGERNILSGGGVGVGEQDGGHFLLPASAEMAATATATVSLD